MKDIISSMALAKNRELCEGKTNWYCDMLKSTAMKIDAILHSSLDLCERRLDTR